jgi:hypothetical protein
MIFLLLSKSSFSLNKSSTLFGIYTPGTFFNPLTPPAVEALCMYNTLYTELFGVLQSTTLSAARFNAKLIDRASDLINEDKLDETQAGLITLASKAALEIVDCNTPNSSV